MSCNCGCGCVTSTFCISPCPCPETVDKSAENINLAGIGVYDGEVNDVFQFRGIRSVNENIVVSLNTTFKTVDLELSSSTFKATKTFTNAANRALTTPDFEGQLGVQLDTDVIYYSTGVAAGDWATDFTFLSGKTTAMATGTQVNLANPATVTINSATNNGTWAFTGVTASFNKPIVIPVGAAGAPSTGFVGDLTTGPYRVGAGQYGISAAGTLTVTVDSVGLKIKNAGVIYSDTTLTVEAVGGLTLAGALGGTDQTLVSVNADIVVHGGGDSGTNGAITIETGTSAQGAGGNITIQSLDTGNITLSTAGAATTITLNPKLQLNLNVNGVNRLFLPAGAIVPADSVLITSGVAGTMSSQLKNTFLSTSNPQAGWGLPTGTLDRATFDPSTIILEELAQRVAALITDLMGVRLPQA